MSQYFTKETDEAIKLFLSTQDETKKKAIFQESIRPAFEKLIENLIFVYGFYNIDNIDTLKMESLSNLYEMLPKFDPTKGTKGFSYFNVVAKNWFIHKTREKAKKARVENELHVDVDHESISEDPNFIVAPYEAQIEEREKWLMFYKAMDSWHQKLTKKTERQVLEAVIFIMKNPDLVPIFNKKAVYLYLRELTSLNTKQVVVNLKKIKMLYEEWQEEYSDRGGLDYELDERGIDS